mmetsp:Transcript_23537/g.75534  ORF Transcript_23537/g.75534 Transcript_23537/m.75534 type:complete len:1018 (+) Transcript_23537:120-3173(+)
MEMPRLTTRHAFGRGPVCSNIALLSLPTDLGLANHQVLHTVGPHLALSGVDCGDMKFLSKSIETHQIIAFAVSSNRKTVAVSELQNCDAEVSLDKYVSPNHDAGVRLFSPAKIRVEARISLYSILGCNHGRILASGDELRVQVGLCTRLKFSPDGRRLAGISPINQRPTAPTSTNLAIWRLETDTLEVTALIPGTKISNIEAFSSGRELSLTTGGKRHFKLWQLSNRGLAAAAVLPLHKEAPWDCVAQDVLAGLTPDNFSSVSSCKTTCERMLLVVVNLSDRVDTQRPDVDTQRPDAHPQESTNSREVHTPNMANDLQAKSVVYCLCMPRKPPHLEVQAVVPIPLPSNAMLTAIAAYKCGFCVVGTHGLISLFVVVQGSKHLFSRVRFLSMCGPTVRDVEMTWSNVATSDTSDAIVLCSSDGTLYTCNTARGSSARSNCHDQGPIVPMLSQGYSCLGSIFAMDVAMSRPLVAVCGKDQTLRIFDHTRCRCEIVHESPADAAPVCLSIHPSAFQLALSNKKSVLIFSILHQSLCLLRSIYLTNCLRVQYSHGGHQFACGTGVGVFIYSTVTTVLLHAISTQPRPVSCILWARDDYSLYSGGDDGAVFGWDMVRREAIDASKLKSNAPYRSLILGLIPERFHDYGAIGDVTCLVGATDAGDLREIVWNSVGNVLHTREIFFGADPSKVPQTCPGDETVAQTMSSESHTAFTLEGLEVPVHASSLKQGADVINCMILSSSWNIAFLGTSLGRVALCSWPMVKAVSGSLVTGFQSTLHTGAVMMMRLSIDDSLLFSAGEDGVLLISAIDVRGVGSLNFGPAEKATCLPNVLGAVKSIHSAASIVQVSLADLENKDNALAVQTRQLDDRRMEVASILHNQELKWATQLNRLQELSVNQLALERTRYEELNNTNERLRCEHRSAMILQEKHHAQAMHQLESQCQQRLAVDLNRYSALQQELLTVQKHCNGLLALQQDSHEQLLRTMQGRTTRMERELRHQIDQLHEESRHNKNMFREVYCSVI